MSNAPVIAVPTTVRRKYSNVPLGTLDKQWRNCVKEASVIRNGRMDGRTYLIAVSKLNQKFKNTEVISIAVASPPFSMNDRA